MLTIHELALQAAAPAQVVRYYARIGLIRAQQQKDNGYRLFALRDVDRIRFIRLAKSLGFTLNEIRQILTHADNGESPCSDVRGILEHRIDENRVKIEEMQALQRRMEQTLERWSKMPDSAPDSNSICRLIESVEEDRIAPIVAARGGVNHVACNR